MSVTEADQFKNYAGRQQTRDVPADQELTQVGPDTLCGEYLRRFWQPVILSSELGDLPKTVRILGEDLVLFRTTQGEIGLLDKHCCHRGTSLEYGIITDEGISCCYHGWHYAVDGTILETPNDPKSRIKDKLRSTAYPTLRIQRHHLCLYGATGIRAGVSPSRHPRGPVTRTTSRIRCSIRATGYRCWRTPKTQSTACSCIPVSAACSSTNPGAHCRLSNGCGRRLAC